MNLSIRQASIADLPQILPIYAQARAFMRSAGNPNQWGESRPTQAQLRTDIAKQQLYICAREGMIMAVFAYIPGIDPTYIHIYDGQWRNDEPYGVIHRIAVAERNQGVASFCFDWALKQCPNLRIDTHRDNLPMRRALAKNGFRYCGIIHLENGDERLAFHKYL